jgi:hypothetical protein
MIKTTVSGVDEIKREIEQLAEKFELPMLTVGIHESAKDPDEGITMAGLGATHEYGADIDHPGGTDYGYANKKAAEDGKVRFLKKGTGFMVLGKTEPHKIKIPARPWLHPGFDSGMQTYMQIIEEGVDKFITGIGDLKKTMESVGVTAVGVVQEYMTALRSPPNTPETVEKKGSDNPLIDSGAMKSSVTYKFQPEKPEEGL